MGGRWSSTRGKVLAAIRIGVPSRWVTPGQAFPHAPPQWAGLAIMVGYALVLTVGGIVLTLRRDVP